jgi:hypothetical protein
MHLHGANAVLSLDLSAVDEPLVLIEVDSIVGHSVWVWGWGLGVGGFGSGFGLVRRFMHWKNITVLAIQ